MSASCARAASLERVAPLDGREQRVLPARVRLVHHVQVELDHLLRVQFAAGDLHEHVGAPWRRRRQLDDQARIESFERLPRVQAVRLVPLVEDDERPQQAQRVAERGLDGRAPHAAVRRERVQVGDRGEQLLLAGGVVVRGEEAVEAARVAEHPQLLLRLAVRRRQHQQQDAQPLPHVPRAEAARLLQHQGAARRRHVELLAVRVVAVLQRLEGLAVYLRGRHDPQHQPGLPAQVAGVDAVDHLRRQQRLAAAGRHLQAERRQRLAQAVAARQVRAAGRRRLPRLPDPVEREVGIVRARLGRLPAPLRQPLDERADAVQRPLLVLLEDHRSSFSTDS